MKLRCTRSLAPGYTVGNTYPVVEEYIEAYLVINDLGGDSTVPLDGGIWGFEIVENIHNRPHLSINGGDMSENTEQAPHFGDKLHIQGITHVFVRIDDDDDWVLVDQGGDLTYHIQEEIDEYRPDPIQQLREKIMEDFRRTSLDEAYTNEGSTLIMSGKDLVDFIVENLKGW